VLERLAGRLLVEFGEQVALQRLESCRLP
jgi:hypothetical protein